MPTFAVKHIDKPHIKQPICKLLRDDKCFFDEFIEEIKADKNLSPELGKIWAIIEDVANGLKVPPKKYKNVGNDTYEAKSKHLRAYHCRKDGLVILVSGGKKTTQKQDMSRAKKIIKEYLQQKIK
jgi:putative component of toxin-antitoxin plasmid stabilization module